MATKASKPRPPSRTPSAKGPGRNSKRTPENRETILGAIRLGLSDKAAFGLAMMGGDCFYEWIRDDPDFADEVKRAREIFKLTLHKRIETASNADWKAGAWLLSRRCSDEYAERAVIDTAGAPCPLDKLFDPAPAEGADDTPQS